MPLKREELIVEIRRLAALAKDAEREMKLRYLADRLEAGEQPLSEIAQPPLDADQVGMALGGTRSH